LTGTNRCIVAVCLSEEGMVSSRWIYRLAVPPILARRQRVARSGEGLSDATDLNMLVITALLPPRLDLPHGSGRPTGGQAPMPLGGASASPACVSPVHRSCLMRRSSPGSRQDSRPRHSSATMRRVDMNACAADDAVPGFHATDRRHARSGGMSSTGLKTTSGKGRNAALSGTRE
jgi:hypothetical protein